MVGHCDRLLTPLFFLVLLIFLHEKLILKKVLGKNWYSKKVLVPNLRIFQSLNLLNLRYAVREKVALIKNPYTLVFGWQKFHPDTINMTLWIYYLEILSCILLYHSFMVGGEVKWKKESEQGWEGRNRRRKGKKEEAQ